MSELASRNCIPCRGGVPKLKGGELTRLLRLLGNDWKVVKGHHLEKKYDFHNFQEALEFTVRVGDMAEQQGHHPDIHLAWGKVVLTVWTHKINGLTESDFVFAAKADHVLDPETSRLAQRLDADDMRRAVDDGMHDLRFRKSRR